MQEKGADVVIAQGVEASGHRGMFLETKIEQQQGTLSTLPQLVKALSIPGIAAGGIVDAKGIKAALLLGACGVQIGTSYLLCDEANTSQIHRRALASDQASETCQTNIFSGRPARGIINRGIRELGPMSDIAPSFPLAGIAITKLRQAAEKIDKNDFTPLWCSKNSLGCKNISATELTKQLMRGFEP